MWVYTWRKRRYNHGPSRPSPREGALLFSTQLINTPKLPQSSATVALTRSWGETPQQLQEENNILSITSWKTWGGGSHINTPTMLHPVYMDLPRIIKKEPLSDPSLAVKTHLLTPGETMQSFDVVSLFTYIPTIKAVDPVRKQLQKDSSSNKLHPCLGLHPVGPLPYHPIFQIQCGCLLVKTCMCHGLLIVTNTANL